ILSRHSERPEPRLERRGCERQIVHEWRQRLGNANVVDRWGKRPQRDRLRWSPVTNGAVVFEERLALAFQIVERRIGRRERLPTGEAGGQEPDRPGREQGFLKGGDVVQEARLWRDGDLRMTDERSERLRLECRLSAVQLIRRC